MDVADEVVRLLQRRDAGEHQLLGQAVLQRPERPLGATARLGRIGRDVLDTQMLQRSADLRGLILRDLAASFRREEIMARSEERRVGKRGRSRGSPYH